MTAVISVTFGARLAVSVAKVGRNVPVVPVTLNHLDPFTAQVTGTLAVPFTDEQLRRFASR